MNALILIFFTLAITGPIYTSAAVAKMDDNQWNELVQDLSNFWQNLLLTNITGSVYNLIICILDHNGNTYGRGPEVAGKLSQLFAHVRSRVETHLFILL